MLYWAFTGKKVLLEINHLPQLSWAKSFLRISEEHDQNTMSRIKLPETLSKTANLLQYSQNHSSCVQQEFLVIIIRNKLTN